MHALVKFGIMMNTKYQQTEGILSSEEPVNPTEFRIKAIPKKKTNPQRKIKQFFLVTKLIPKQAEKNFQGFPLAECVYEEEIDKTVYSPPDWGFTQADGCRSDWDFCQKCLL